MFQAVQDLLLSSFKAILGAMALGAAAFVRAWWQSRVTALEVESVERGSKAREGRGRDENPQADPADVDDDRVGAARLNLAANGGDHATLPSPRCRMCTVPVSPTRTC